MYLIRERKICTCAICINVCGMVCDLYNVVYFSIPIVTCTCNCRALASIIEVISS